MLPLSFVTGAGFQYFCSLMNPEFKVPTAPVVRSHVKKLYLDLKPVIIKELENEHVSLSIDLWTSIAHMPFLGLYGHYISKEWVLENVLLGCRKFDDKHTGKCVQNCKLIILIL